MYFLRIFSCNLFVSAQGTNSTQSLLEDSQALLLVKAAITKDPYNVTRYWKRQGKRQVLNACRWLGITCTKRRVTGVNISGHALEGSISADLGRLAHLTTLDMSTNFLSGSIPTELSGATWLQSLNLGSNRLTGSIPSSLGGLKNLTYLVLANNKLDGSFPSSIVNMTSLTTLNISSNNFTGTIPSGLQNLKNLTVLDVSNNGFQGGLPSTLGAWMSLVKLDFSNNPLAGGIPTTIGDLTALEGLWLSDCSLTGQIPQQITGCTKLIEIDLSNNGFRGSIPFQSLGNLTSLHLQNNLLEGNFVTNLGMFPKLEDIDLANNRLNGSISDQIGNLPLKYNLSLAHNNLTGSIPDGVGGLTHVQRIDLSSNGFSGIIPSAIGNCTNLAELDVSSNRLTGSLPQSLDFLTSLTGLNVSHNMLSGSLPTFDNLTNLRVLDASFNNFSGKVSGTFVNFSSLLFLNVSYNGLSGELPVFTAHDNVTADSFRNNYLCGSILNIVCGGGSSDKLSTKTIIYIVIGSLAGFIVALGILYFCVACWKARKSKGSKHSSQVSAELQLQLSSEEILTATKGFDDGNRIGIGKLSTVHRGVLPDETVVAVKRLAITKSAPGKELENAPSLDEELETLGHIRHRSLVKVLGYCSTEQIKALVLEYMPNGTLEGLLYPPREAEVVKAVDWNVRFNSAIAIAEGLKFLHHDSRRPVVHGDIKPSNVLFDARMEAKIADYGVARILADQGFGPSASPSASPSGSAYGYTSPGKTPLQHLCVFFHAISGAVIFLWLFWIQYQ